MPHVVSRRHRRPDARVIVIAALCVTASGCQSLACGPLYAACVPVEIAMYGVMALSEASSPARTGRYGGKPDRWTGSISTLAAAGSLSVVWGSVSRLTANRYAATLLVDPDAPGKDGRKSYLIDVEAYCETGKLAVYEVHTYAGGSGPDNRIRSQQLLHATAEKPEPPFDAAVRRICSPVSTHFAANANAPTRLVHAGDLGASDFSSGALLVDMNSIVAKDASTGTFDGTLVVNLAKTIDGPRVSIEADVSVACATGEVTFSRQRTYDDWNGQGQPVVQDAPTIGLAPGPQRDTVVGAFCGQKLNGWTDRLAR